MPVNDSIKISSRMVREYVDRELGPQEERLFEERMLEDEQLLAQVQSELALRRGLAIIARQDTAASVARDAPNAADGGSAADVLSLTDARQRRAQNGGSGKR
jgi:hypothetical protein